MYSVRLLTEDDYTTLQKWWRWHRFSIPPQDCLPSNGEGGIMVSKDGVEICAGFIYFTNSKIAWLEYVVSNPDYREKDRKEAIQFLIDELTGIASRQGFKAIFTSVKNQNLIKSFDACGFSGDRNNSHEMIKIL